MKTVEQRQWRHSGAFIVKCEHALHIVLIVDFELANVYSVHI